MNVIIFLIIIGIIFFFAYYRFMFIAFKAKFIKHFFWVLGIGSIAYAMIFTGLIDRIFIIVFSGVLVVSKVFLTMIDKS